MKNKNVWYNWPLILAYHSISLRRVDSLSVMVANFEKQIAWLHGKGFRSITLADFISKKFDKEEPIVIITFDDGYKDNYSQAFPVLKKYGYVATIFLVSDHVNTDHIFYWDVPKISSRYPESLFKILTWEQIYEMADYGIEFGSHSCTHPELTKISADQCRQEIDRSRSDIKLKLGREVMSFSYPRGNLNSETIQMVEDAGYSCAVITPPRWGIPLNHYTLRRMGIYYTNSNKIFRLKTRSVVRRNYERLLWFQSH